MCGKPWPSKWSLRAHLKAHKSEMCKFTVSIPKSMRGDFTDLCHAHGLTTCHVTVALMDAAIQSFRRGVTFTWDARTEAVRYSEGSNPLQVSIHQTFLGKPRSPYKVQLSPSVSAPVRGRCPDCGSYHISERLVSTGSMREGRCQDCSAEWIISPIAKVKSGGWKG
jgi:hypothetical protein